MDTKLKEYRKEWNANLKDVKISFEAKLDELRRILDKKDKVIGELNQDVGRLNHDVGNLKEKDELIDQLTKDLDDAKQSLNFLTHETTGLSNAIKGNQTTVQESKKLVEEVKAKTEDLEDRSRRNNLVFFNIQEADKGVSENCEHHIQALLAQTGIAEQLQGDIWIDRAHRLGPIKKKEDGKTRPIIVKFTYYKQKQGILANGKLLKHVPANMSEDYSKATLDIHRKLIEIAKESKKKNPNITSHKLTYRRITFRGQSPGSDRFIGRSFSLRDIEEDPHWYNFIS